MVGNLAQTLAWLQGIAAKHPAVLVGLSGGKDSLVTLDLCVRTWGQDNVQAFAMHFLPGLKCFDGQIDTAERRWKIKIHRVMHFESATMIAQGVFRPRIKELILGERRIPMTIKPMDVYNQARKLSGIDLMATGERKNDSLMRRGMISQCAGYSEKMRRIFPLGEWTARDVMSYLRLRRIPIPKNIGGGIIGSGIDLRLETLRQLRDEFPDDYAKIIEVFPLAESQFAREEFKKAREAEQAAAQALDKASNDSVS